MGVVASNKNLKQNLRVFWKLVNLQDCVWENLYQIIMKDHIAGKGDNSLQHFNLVHKYVSKTTETMEDEEHRTLGKPITKARPRMKSTTTLTPVSVPLRERKGSTLILELRHIKSNDQIATT